MWEIELHGSRKLIMETTLDLVTCSELKGRKDKTKEPDNSQAQLA